MRDQYVGDVSDVIKIGFLRALAGTDRILGVSWYYVPKNDGRPDGRHQEWRGEAAWQRLDAQLHAGLLSMTDRTVAALQRTSIWPSGTLFHNEPMPPRLARDAWSQGKRRRLEGADVVFLDPDNGLGKDSLKHATLSEVRLLRKEGRAVVLISFPGRNLPHDVLMEKLHDRLRSETGADAVMTLRTNVSVPSLKRSNYFVQRQRWFTVIDPERELMARARGFAEALSLIPRVSARVCE